MGERDGDKTQGRVRVYVADSNPLFLAALVTATKRYEDVEFVGSGRTSSQVVRDVVRLRPQVAMIGDLLPHTDAGETLAVVARIAACATVVCLVARLEDRLALEALAAGAAGCLSKDADFAEVHESIVAAGHHQITLPPQIQVRLLEHFREHAAVRDATLTQREHEVLVLAAEGLTVSEMARHLSVGVATVKAHLQNLYEKLHVHSRAAAVAEGLRRGLLD